MELPETAEAIRERLAEEHEESLLAVGWYDGDTDQRTGSVYISEEFGRATEGSGALETAMLESFGREMCGSIHDERLTTTVRLYESVADIDLHVDEFRGIVIAVRQDEVALKEVLQPAREIVTDSLDVSGEW